MKGYLGWFLPCVDSAYHYQMLFRLSSQVDKIMRLIYLTNRDSEDHGPKYEADHCPRGATPILKKDIGEVCHRFRVESSQKQACFLLAGWSGSYLPWSDKWSRRKQFCHRFGAGTCHGEPRHNTIGHEIIFLLNFHTINTWKQLPLSLWYFLCWWY